MLVMRPSKFAERHHGSGEGDGTNEYAEQHLDLQQRDLGRILLGELFNESGRGRFSPSGFKCDESKFGVDADKDRGQSDKGVKRSNELRHSGHLDPECDNGSDSCTDKHHRPDSREVPDAWGQNGRCHGKSHAGNAVPDCPLGALLVGQSAERKNEHHACCDIGGLQQSFRYHDEASAQLRWNMASMRLVTRKPPTTLIVAMRTETAERM